MQGKVSQRCLRTSIAVSSSQENRNVEPSPLADTPGDRGAGPFPPCRRHVREKFPNHEVLRDPGGIQTD